MRLQTDIAPVCANCRFLEDYPHTEAQSQSRSWCRIWRLIIPDPPHTGCTSFQPKAAPAEEPSNQ